MADATWEQFVLTFVPLLIAIDAIGNLPFIIALSEDMTTSERRRMVHIAVLTATVVGLTFLFLGRLVLDVIGISVGAFAIAGGLVLLALSIRHMTTGHMVEVIKEEMVAVVPMGTPLLAGPAAITTLLLLETQFPLYMVLVAFIVNLAITWLIFMLSNLIVRLLGRGGIRAVSRILGLLLAAIAVSMVLRGLELEGIIAAAMQYGDYISALMVK